MNFTCLLNQAVTLSIFDVNPWLLVVVAVIALAMGIVLLTARPTITYVDTEGDTVIHTEKHPLFKRVKLHGSAKSGKKLIGWSKVLGKSAPIDKSSVCVIRSMTLYTIWEDVETNSAVSIEFNYMDADEDVAVKKEFFVLNTKLPDEQIDGVEIDGWGFAPDEAPILTKEDVEATFVINLYPIFEESPVSQAGVPTNSKAIVDLLFTDSVANKNIYKESHYLKLSLPEENEQYDNFLGWGFKKDGEIILDKSGADSIFTIQLFSRGVLPVEEAAEEVAPEVVEEEAPVEVVEDVAEEEVPVEVIEEVAEEETEKTAEEAIEEVVEIVEEPIPAAEEVAEEVPAQVIEEVEEEVPVEVIEEVEEEVPVEVIEEVAEEEAPAQVVEEVVPEVVEEVIEAPVEAEPEVVEVSGEATTVVVPTYFDKDGNKLDIKLSRSITANIIQSDDTVKSYYNELKNYILSFKGVKSRISWKFDSYNRGRDQLFKMKLRGKTICLYCNLDPNDFDKSKYHHEAIDAKIFADVPMLVKVKSGLGLRKAKELVDIVMAKFEIETNPKAKEVDYISMYPYEENAPLIERGLIKLLIPDDAIIVKSTKPVEEVTEEEALVSEEVAPEVVEEVAPEVVEEVAPEVVEEVIEEAPAEVIEEVVEEPVPEVIEEPEVEEVIEEVYEEHEVIVEEISAEDADQIAEEQHVDVHVEEGVEYISAKDNKKSIVNVDTLSDAFEAHDIVNLASMKEKGLVDKRAKTVKVLARGTLNKPLIVKAGDFSKTAVEMILLTGGNAVHVIYKVKK